jgi:hypothetical protein
MYGNSNCNDKSSMAIPEVKEDGFQKEGVMSWLGEQPINQHRLISKESISK